jgi:hypothetical protein
MVPRVVGTSLARPVDSSSQNWPSSIALAEAHPQPHRSPRSGPRRAAHVNRADDKPTCSEHTRNGHPPPVLQPNRTRLFSTPFR